MSRFSNSEGDRACRATIAAAALQLDHVRAERVALALVGADVGDVGEGQLAVVSSVMRVAPRGCRRRGRSSCSGCIGVGAGLLGDRRVGEVAVAGDDVAAGRCVISSPSLRRDRDRDVASFSARRPHMPSMPVHCCTSLTLVPVSFIRSRLFSPMFWARRWHGVWYVTVAGTSPVKSVSSDGAVGLVHLHQVLGGVEGVRGDELGVGAADVVDVVLLQDVAARRLRHDDVAALADRVGERRDVLRRRPW